MEFIDYLSAIGCDLIQIKSEWETARFIANDIHCVVYHNSKGGSSYSNETAQNIHQAWLKGIKIKLPNIKRKSVKKLLKDKIIQRDGFVCFYSGKELSYDDLTIEHLIPVCRGGKNTLENMVLCTKEENQKMGDKDLITKIKYRDSIK